MAKRTSDRNCLGADSRAIIFWRVYPCLFENGALTIKFRIKFPDKLAKRLLYRFFLVRGFIPASGSVSETLSSVGAACNVTSRPG